MDLPQAVREAADVSAVNQLILRERESRDMWRWDDLRDCYHPDGRVHVSWISLDPRELQGFRPSYRLLAYVLSQKGYSIGSDLPGEDKPENVRALMDEVFGWAGVKN